jgi:tRNA pseudouridine55 synthase
MSNSTDDDIDLVITVNKPKGITCNDLLSIIKRQINTKKNKIKIGHGGTLDKDACGVLVIGLGKGTKRLGKLLSDNKKYIVTGEFGYQTNTYDRSGDITNSCDKVISETELNDIIKHFIGKIKQIPPKFSALKIKGKRASDRVRDGEEIVMKAREVEIFSIAMTEFKFPFFKLEVHCGGGTYMRSLVNDIGTELKTCSCMTELTRTQQAKFILDDAVDYKEITMEYLVSM